MGNIQQVVQLRTMAAALPQGEENLSVHPTNNALNRQAQYTIAENSERRLQGMQRVEIVNLTVELQGQWVKLPVQLAELREALGHPPYKLTDMEEADEPGVD